MKIRNFVKSAIFATGFLRVVFGHAEELTHFQIRWPSAFPETILSDNEDSAIIVTGGSAGYHRNRVDKNKWLTESPVERGADLRSWFQAKTESAERYHLNVCFRGHGAQVAIDFFGDIGKTLPSVQGVSELSASFSEDGKALGIEFLENGEKNWKQVQIYRCLHPQSSHGTSLTERKTLANSFKNRVSTPSKLDPAYGYSVIDHLDAGEAGPKKRFVLHTDYKKAAESVAREEKTLPWRGLKLDIRKTDQAFQFSYMILAYIYDGMAESTQVENDFDPASSPRMWCQIPWMNALPDGRELAHGLFYEGISAPSQWIYPQLKRAGGRGTSFDTAFYNAWGCSTLNQVFERDRPPAWEKAQFPLNTVSFKLLWTTADFDRSGPFSGLRNAPTWNGHVSDVPMGLRKMTPLRLFQIDAAAKIPVAGSVNELNGWVFMAYVYDENFDLNQEPGWKEFGLKRKVTSGFEHLRPIGVQFGLDQDQSIIFFKWVGGKLVLNSPGSPQGDLMTHQDQGKLAGPGDTSSSSCMGCHTTAGTRQAAIPGFNSMSEFQKSPQTFNFDLNLQMERARKNEQTQGEHSQ